jgi:hypothetical protein
VNPAVQPHVLNKVFLKVDTILATLPNNNVFVLEKEQKLAKNIELTPFLASSFILYHRYSYIW